VNRLQANICLLAATLCWSSEVVIPGIILFQEELGMMPYKQAPAGELPDPR